MANILVVDDDKKICDLLEAELRRLGHETQSAGTSQQALDLAGADNFDVVYLDVQLPGRSGLEIIPEIRQTPGEPEVIIMTGYGSPDGAELAVKNGAWDYIQKPAPRNQLILALMRALQFREQSRAAKHPALLKRNLIIGESHRINQCLSLVAQAAATEASVLITGETGTGKELFARAIHENSRRNSEPFVVVDCAALPDTLAESVLFGHEKGAFTGAEKPRSGLIRRANKGTLFLDEMGELPIELQKSFLRVLQEHRFHPLGSDREVESDFRVVVATNRNMEDMVQKGEFRQDLYFRLKAFEIHLPALRHRPEDIKPMVIFHTNRLCEHYGIPTRGFSPDFFEALALYDWPGNVRELVNTLEWVLARTVNEPTLFARHLPIEIRAKAARVTVEANREIELETEQEPARPEDIPSFKEYRKQKVEAAETGYLKLLLKQTAGDIQQAMAVSELSKARLYELLKKHGLSAKQSQG
ncbi:sigma-54-dependent transcriptional regulator [Dethiosulfatarculus sandiegensis]|uniref:Fis family transcriptional regulator n=1 Tax=Dethiosulfatarculus sandiegensis TaxID=1429043 RepID=A0A0D2GB57_9BACT|nr:sigma-54 dependent transcriptional regulator [Dethiosulfatarculus sandiegensis]KIX12087.1 Fis family transcriptional regulator [Dethiosulfatarculus sandiegensis]